jgi:hypothetical protein
MDGWRDGWWTMWWRRVFSPFGFKGRVCPAFRFSDRTTKSKRSAPNKDNNDVRDVTRSGAGRGPSRIESSSGGLALNGGELSRHHARDQEVTRHIVKRSFARRHSLL